MLNSFINLLEEWERKRSGNIFKTKDDSLYSMFVEELSCEPYTKSIKSSNFRLLGQGKVFYCKWASFNSA